MPHNVCYEFGPYHLDLDRRVLTRSGEIISLTPKAADILGILINNAGQLVEKEALLKEVWPDTFVEEANLTQNIFMLRRALGDDRAGPKYIETVTRRGYRFIATVRAVDPNGTEAKTVDALQGPLTSGVAVNRVLVIAVLPFVNATGDGDLEYLAEGVTDSVINKLSRISKLRVMSRSAIFRYKTQDFDPQEAGKQLGATAVLVGKIKARPGSILIEVELVDPSTGWQLWGENFDLESSDLLQTQDAITTQVLAAMKLRLTGDEEQRVTARYTENAAAYQSYLEGRHHWSSYTREGIEKAIQHFERAIELDPNYALAYAGIIDCYLRLATNYLPPEGDVPASTNAALAYRPAGGDDNSDPRVRLRFEWDWKGAERELRRANELQTTYPTAHQWYAAYKSVQKVYEQTMFANNQTGLKSRLSASCGNRLLPPYLGSLELTLSEQVQVYCAISREQIDAGNYEAASKVLSPWWLVGNWPSVGGLDQRSCADLLFTAGELAGFLASTQQIPRGQRLGENLLNGSIALFEQLGIGRRAAESRIELALCYYRQGLFDIGRSALIHVLDELSRQDWELRGLALIRLASLERHAGRIKDAVVRLLEAMELVELAGPWATARCYLELASTYKDLAVSEAVAEYFDRSKEFYFKALYEFEAVGNHRYVAIVENNLGLLFLMVRRYETSERHLVRARKLFEGFSDCIRGAQVNETLARLYLATGQYKLAQNVIGTAVEIMEKTDGDALLAEALTTKGIVDCKLGLYSEAKRSFEAAYKIAERCGDIEGAGRALLIMIEEMGDQFEVLEKREMHQRLRVIFAVTQQADLQARVRRLINEAGL
jgi:DNA-binding winged helix-turn-helix (wHTH) protein